MAVPSGPAEMKEQGDPADLGFGDRPLLTIVSLYLPVGEHQGLEFDELLWKPVKGTEEGGRVPT